MGMTSWVVGGVIAAAALACAGTASADCSPPTMVKIVTRAANVDPATFGAKPKTMYRVGVGRARMEGEPDPQQGLHLVNIVNEPDIWVANRIDHSGQHIVDPGPSLKVHLPLFAEGDGVLKDLEFGCESAFVAQYAPKAEHRVRIGLHFGELHRAVAGDAAVEIVMTNHGVPLQAAYYKAGKLLLKLDYTTYETGLAVDEALFHPPAGFTWVERRPGR
jgi:hypothetical protein